MQLVDLADAHVVACSSGSAWPIRRAVPHQRDCSYWPVLRMPHSRELQHCVAPPDTCRSSATTRHTPVLGRFFRNAIAIDLYTRGGACEQQLASHLQQSQRADWRDDSTPTGKRWYRCSGGDIVQHQARAQECMSLLLASRLAFHVVDVLCVCGVDCRRRL
jgi:hypothetical protein